MQLEVGKTYENRAGRIVRIFKEANCNGWPYIGRYVDNGEGAGSFRPSGFYWYAWKPGDFDLVKEVVKEVVKDVVVEPAWSIKASGIIHEMNRDFKRLEANAVEMLGRLEVALLDTEDNS